MMATDSVATTANPPLTSGELVLGGLLTVWIAACDVALKAIARIGGCDGRRPLTTDVFGDLWSPPTACPGTELVGSAVVLGPEIREGTVFGLLADVLHGVGGQIWGLGLLALAAIVTIFVLRWRWRAAGDAAALGSMWAGILVHALPRLAGAGHSFTELTLFGIGTGIGDLALFWSAVWLIGRLVGELRA